jgi:hypothetical protein
MFVLTPTSATTTSVKEPEELYQTSEEELWFLFLPLALARNNLLVTQILLVVGLKRGVQLGILVLLLSVESY